MRNGHIGCDCCRVFCIRFVPSANKKEIIVTFAHCCEYNVTKGKVMSRYAVVNNGAKQIKKRKILRRLLSALVAVVIFAIIILAWVYWKSMTPTILDVAQTRIKSETTRAISEAVNIAMTDACTYSDFVTIEKNANDEISLIYADSVKVNALARQMAIASQNKINSIASFDVNIPLGTLSGVPLLSEKGPKVNIVVSPVGTVNCTFSSTFQTAGINQTLHRIYINVESVVDLIIPTAHTQVTTLTPILLCESVIIGKVPDTFLQGGFVLGS